MINNGLRQLIVVKSGLIVLWLWFQNGFNFSRFLMVGGLPGPTKIAGTCFTQVCYWLLLLVLNDPWVSVSDQISISSSKLCWWNILVYQIIMLKTVDNMLTFDVYLRSYLPTWFKSRGFLNHGWNVLNLLWILHRGHTTKQLMTMMVLNFDDR